MEFEKGITHLETFDASCISLDANLDSSDVFILGGIMNPKELYLKDDGDADVTTKDSGSSSDSGISGGSALDDLHDIADVTELNSLIDGELKELDFSIDFTLPRLEDSSFNPAELLAEVKQEPSSPSSVQDSKPASPDFYNDPLNEISIKEESAACLSPRNQHLIQQHQLHSHHVGSSCYQQDVHSYGGYHIQEQQYTVQAAPLSSKHGYIIPSSYQPLSPSSSSSSPPPSANMLPLGQNCPPQQQKIFSYSANSCPSVGKTHGYIINSNKRRASLNQVVPRPTASYPTPSVVPAPISSPCSVSPPSGQIDAILNNNIRIQPKPGADLVVSTAGNLQWVTTSGNLPSQAGIPVATQQGIPILGSPGSITAITDEKSLKRAQRIIKNRESACLSRKRKKEYMSSLEERLQQCASENERLVKENESLRQQVDLLQKENKELKQPQGSAAKKICLMCVAILLTLNLTSFSLTGSSSDSLSSLSITGGSGGMEINHHPSGRSLLGLSDPELLQEYEDQDISRNTNGDTLNVGSRKQLRARLLEEDGILRFDKELNLLAQKLNQTSCSMYFNSTESLRLADELRGWMIRQEEEKQKKKKRASSRTAQSESESGSKQHGSATTARHRRQKSYLPVRHFGTSATYRGEDSVGQHYPMQVFSPGFGRQERLLNAIPRRNDTFYVFSFSTDYFLVPATAHNKTARPRMSLLMPVVSSSVNESGDTGPSDQVGVMQIDCEILNTNLIHVHRSVFPDSESTTHNASTAHSFETQFYQNGSSNSNFNAESHQNMSSKSMLHRSNSSKSNDVNSRHKVRKSKLQDTLKKLNRV